jgi:hypothetical protein
MPRLSRGVPIVEQATLAKPALGQQQGDGGEIELDSADLICSMSVSAAAPSAVG